MHATFASAFLRGDPRAAEFLPADFRDPLTRSRLARQAAARLISAELVAELQTQEQELTAVKSEARRKNLDALLHASRQGGVAAVVTGQQVGLFLGPLYTFYKAASAIAAARSIEKESGVRCVPIFWLQTEDHDYEEINHCRVLCPGAAPLHLQLSSAMSPAAGEGLTDGAATRVSIAHRPLGEEVTAQLEALESSLASLPHAEAFLKLLRAHYRPGRKLGTAFGGVLSEVFAEEGLLVMDPRRKTIAALAAPLYKLSLSEQGAITAALQARSLTLREAGFDEQVHVRPDTALLFFHEGGVEGPRYRLERQGSGWGLPSRPLSDDELLAALLHEPLRFSTSALLRPIVQDRLLPTVAYIGGPGELNYFAQLPKLYELFGVPPCLVVPRARFRCLEDNTRALLGKLGLSAAEAEAARAEVLRRIAARSQSAYPEPESVRARLLGDIAARLDEVAAIDAALRDPVKRTRESIEHNIGKLVERYGRVLLERDSTTTERVDRLQGFLFPEGMPQERYYSLIYFACKYGLAGFKQKVFAHLSSFDLLSVENQGVRDLEL